MGEATIEADNRVTRLEAGQCALSLTHDCYIYRTIAMEGGPTHVSWCDGRPQNSVWLYDELGKIPSAITATPQFQTNMQLGVDLGIGDRDGRGGLREALTNALLNAYIYGAGVIESERPMSQTILRARKYIDDNFA